MITLITGVPGMGKTAMLVHTLLKNHKETFNSRPVFVMGVNGLLLEHNPAPPVEEWTHKQVSPEDDSLFLDYYNFPPNSILVVDEAQRVFRARSSGSKPPPHVMALETHRHTGLDIILLTQKPHLLDSNVRELCGRHVHIKNTILGRKLFEWFEFNDVNNRANLDAAVRRSYKPPKEVFSLYKSAEVHTKQPRRFHQIWLYISVALIAFFYFSSQIYNRITENLEPKPKSNQPDLLAKIDNLSPSELVPVSTSASVPVPVVNTDLPQHPYMDYTFYITGDIQSSKKHIYYYRLVSESSELDVTSEDLIKAGYSITYLNHCANFMFYQGAKVVATCRGDGAGQVRSLQAANLPSVKPDVGGIGGVAPDDGLEVPPNSVGLASPSSPSNSASM